ncbi:hypothetical protein OIU80_10685, partial [Flavobacterium sp. LS1R47]
MTFEITHKINTIVNDNVKEIQTSFDVEFLALEKKSDFNTYEISKTKALNTPSDENTYLTFLENLDQLTYPIKIQTTSQGEFVKMVEYKKWLERWEENIAILMEEYKGSENANDILEKFNLNVYDEETFIQNKFKETFWNLIFLNPKIDNGQQPNNTVINWYIKSIGSLECIGKTKFIQSDTGESLLCFESQDIVNEECTERINFITNNKANQNQYVTNLKVITALEESYRKIQYKSAVFEIQTDTLFHYKEETILK